MYIPKFLEVVQRVELSISFFLLLIHPLYLFGSNLEHSEYMVGGWPWQILGAIRAAATAKEPGEILFFVRETTHNFTDFTSANYISRNLITTTSIGVAIKTFGTEF